MPPSIPRATYRWQFHAGFTFQQAREKIPYLAELGVSHVYASPFFRASPGTTHGYDVSNPNEFNPEIGSREEFDSLTAELQRHEMGLVVDFVPNHMGVADTTNDWWMHVLEHGQASPYARFFDIEWEPQRPGMAGKVLYPVLAEQYGRTLEAGKFAITFEDGAFRLRCERLDLPMDAGTLMPLLEEATAGMDDAPDELHSIMTALRNLPARTENDDFRAAERVRESRITKDRLAQLCGEQASVREAIQRTVQSWCDASNLQSLDKLDALISAQAYRLSFWRVAAEEINYRRFFDVNSLAGVRVELPEVFEHIHRLLLELVESGQIQGIRIDHIDGLAKPLEYLETLRRAVEQRRPSGAGEPFYIVVEKILSGNERLRPNWPVQGTTGYDFISEAMRVLIDRRAEPAIDECYEEFAQLPEPCGEVIYQSKKLVMQTSLASEVNMLGILLSRLARSHRWYRDFTLNSLTTSVREAIACFPVYRTYLAPNTPPDSEDSQILSRAFSTARRRNPALERTIFEFFRHMLVPPEGEERPVDEETRRVFMLKFQQCTGPVTAKGVEDTAFYIYNRFIAINEVGCSPLFFGMPVEEFHARCVARKDFPHSMLATSTHDTKRSGDVRARLAAISEFPPQWRRVVTQWKAVNAPLKRTVQGEPAPDNNEEYLLYQTIVGSWPLHDMTSEERHTYLERIQAYMAKALREAKINSSWIEPNDPWHEATNEFIAAILNPDVEHSLPDYVRKFIQKLASVGSINSLTQNVLKLTVPGVADIYQGTEMWDFSLVDPDNRRPVDYELRQKMLGQLDGAPEKLLSRWRDGRIKLFAIKRLLELRRRLPSLFAHGAYVPLTVEGQFGNNCIAFERQYEGAALLVAVPRLVSQVGTPPVGDCWDNTKLLPATTPGIWRDLFTDQTSRGGPDLHLAEVLKTLPFAVLVAEA